MQQRDPLYMEVSRLGRQRSPLSRATLSRYPLILNSRAVDALVTASGTSGCGPDKRVDLAAQLIRYALAQLRGAREQLVGRAVFGLGEFDGLTPAERAELLEAHRLTVRIDIYKPVRVAVIEHVHSYLASGSPVELGPTPPPGFRLPPLPGNAPPEARGIPKEAADVARFLTVQITNLHYACLACLFVASTDDTLGRSDIQIDRDLVYLEYGDKPLSWAFFVAFGYIEWAQSRMERSFSLWGSEHISIGTNPLLWWIINSTMDFGPLVTGARFLICEQLRAQRAGNEVSRELVDAVRETWQEDWQPWLSNGLREKEIAARSELEVIAAKTAGAIHLLRALVGVDRDLEQQTAFKYLQTVEHYYNMHNDIILDGHTIGYHAAEYLGSATSTLATSPLIWQRYSWSAKPKTDWTEVRIAPPNWRDAL